MELPRTRTPHCLFNVYLRTGLADYHHPREETSIFLQHPFTVEGPDLFNLVTKVRMPDKVKKDLCDQSVIGNKLLRTFVKEWIQTAEKGIWDVVKKRKPLTWKTTRKTVRVATKDKVISSLISVMDFSSSHSGYFS